MNEPPRYQPLRELPARAYVPGQSERPVVDSERAYLHAERWAEHTQYLWGADLYNNGFFWEAHEAWESLWRAAAHDATQRAYFQALILCAAACLKGVQHDVAAARRLAARALLRLELVQAAYAERFMGLELAQFSSSFRAFADRDPTVVADRPRIVLSRDPSTRP